MTHSTGSGLAYTLASCPACGRRAGCISGHLVGALGNWVPLQAQYECFYFVADWHALTSDFADTSQLTTYLRERRRLDRRRARSEKSTFFIQSLVPEHAELFLLLSMVVPVPWLERVPTYKEQQENLKDKDLSSIGFLGYPLLQTADVAMYDARFVPVGERSGGAPRARARGRPPVQQRLRRRGLSSPQAAVERRSGAFPGSTATRR